MTELTNLSVEMLLLLPGPASDSLLTARKRDVQIRGGAIQTQVNGFCAFVSFTPIPHAFAVSPIVSPLKGSGDSLDCNSCFQLSVLCEPADH